MGKTKENKGEGNLPSFYAIIPAHIRYNERLSAQAKLFYAEITALCNKTGECWANNEYFRKYYKLSKRMVSQIISDLEDEGLLNIEYTFEIINKKKISKRTMKIVDMSINKKEKKGVEENFKGGKKLQGGVEENFYGGIEKNFYHNNTRYNNTSLITCDDDKNKEKEKSKNELDELFKPTKNDKLDLQQAKELFYKWQNFAKENNLVQLIKLTSIRLRNIKARLNESEFNFDEILGAIKSNDFWRTKFANGQGVGFDDITKSDNLYLKILEGSVRKNNFSNNGNTNGNSTKRIKCEFCSQSLVDGKHCYTRNCKNEMPIFLSDE